jgi:hypothetical protein
MMHDPHLHIEQTECDAAPRPGAWWILALLVVIVIAEALWIIGRMMINAALSIAWPV